MKRNLLLTPGPTQVPPELCAALALPLIHHRTPKFQEFLKEAIDYLKAELSELKKIHYFTDGCGGQYKNRYNLSKNSCNLLPFVTHEKYFP